MKQISCYKTKDNKLFENYKEAKEHEMKINKEEDIRQVVVKYITKNKYIDMIDEIQRNKFSRVDLIDLATDMILENIIPIKSILGK